MIIQLEKVLEDSVQLGRSDGYRNEIAALLKGHMKALISTRIGRGLFSTQSIHGTLDLSWGEETAAPRLTDQAQDAYTAETRCYHIRGSLPVQISTVIDAFPSFRVLAVVRDYQANRSFTRKLARCEKVIMQWLKSNNNKQRSDDVHSTSSGASNAAIFTSANAVISPPVNTATSPPSVGLPPRAVILGAGQSSPSSSAREPPSEVAFQPSVTQAVTRVSASLPVSSTDVSERTVLFFGETGIGKSSLINMIAGAEIAGVSGDAMGCTFSSRKYTVNLDGISYNLWDTAGLNEGEKGTVPAEEAAMKLQELLRHVSGGVNLLVYCVRGSRFKDIIRVNYEVFYTAIFQQRVPIVVVITGLENEDPMESWWTRNEEEFRRCGMNFFGHACVTTTKGKQLKSGEYLYEEEYADSKATVKRLITQHSSHRPEVFDYDPWLHQVNNSFQRSYGRAAVTQEGGHYAEAPYASPTLHFLGKLLLALSRFL